MIEAFKRTTAEIEDRRITLQAYINVLPKGAPRDVVRDGWDYTGYCAKPFALREALRDSDIAILLDAAFYQIRDIQPLINHIIEHGYYLCDNGAVVGEWASDECLRQMGCGREAAMSIVEASSYCVGLYNDERGRNLAARWCEPAPGRGPEFVFPGPHTNHGRAGRNQGFVSDDDRVKGHRHDQSALSIIAHRMGMHTLVPRPRFTAYALSETEETVLVNQGMGS